MCVGGGGAFELCVCEGELIVSSCTKQIMLGESSKHDSYCRLTSRTYLLRVVLSLRVGGCKNGALGIQLTHQSSLHQQYTHYM